MARAARTRLNPEERRKQLMLAAIDLFAEKGFGEAKHADIARRVGVSTAATFVYFPTREALLDAVIEEITAFYLDFFNGIEVLKGGAPATLRMLAFQMLKTVETHANYVLVHQGWAARFDTHMRQRYLAFQDEVLSKLSEILWASEDNISRDNRDDARILLSASHALSVMKIDGEPEEKLARFTDHTIDVVLAYGKRDLKP